MASKSKVSNPLNGMHTAGIFSDMSIDGPEIGTLVLIVDRAKNLPNRKTIGKQDPYCAARLGKEAKKTTTDIRGGQTPKWDQELRFNVHDSPDYYQLKLSIFNDDKKTELIGESWIDLRDVIVGGGGQSDQWHTLNCRGKYAGEIRIEITYYDSRPKPEKAAPKLTPVTSNSDSDTAMNGQRALPVKRRPLPSDPVTGQVPAPPPDPVQTPPRAQPNPPAAFIPTQSPLQNVEYNTPPATRLGQPDHYSPAHPPGNKYSTPPRRDYQSLGELERMDNMHTSPYEGDSFYQTPPTHSRPNESDNRNSLPLIRPDYSTQSLPIQPRRSMDTGERPPPPPAHRAMNSGGYSPDSMHRGSYDMLQQQHKATPPMRHDVLRNEAHRSSVPSPSSAYPGRPTYRPYDSAPTMQKSPRNHEEFDADHHTPPRHHSYDQVYDTHHRGMQPTVEDVPDSWTPPKPKPRGSMSHYDEFNTSTSSGSLVLSRRGDVPPEQYRNPVYSPSQQGYDKYGQSSPSPLSSVDYSQELARVPRLRGEYQMDRYQNHPNELDSNHIRSSSYHDLSSTLIPGSDPGMALEVAGRFHQDARRERRYTQPTQMVVHTRGRQQSEPPSNYPQYSQGYSPNPQPNNSRPYDRPPFAHSSGPSTPTGLPLGNDHRRVSPNPAAHHHTIKRKSVSPAPPPSDTRRLSDIPFGPDSYDAFNPSVAASKESSNSVDYTNADGKIVTPDGREIDPSDHLPMDTWAPEPEPKKPGAQSETPNRSRPVPGGAQPMPTSGRRPLRIAARPTSMTMTPPSYSTPEPVSAPVSAGRNRLQKKNHRASAMPAPIASSSSPLGPATAHQRNSTPPRALVRASTFDYENHSLPYEGDSGGARVGYGSGPPIPAKVPVMSGGLGPSGSGSRGHEELSLMEEIGRIDIGTGRARRHGGY
ncbi:hypothetical protein F5Y16DRAFT_355970 [Xylariaceae sp. FL0255]|nr:hypothetical protein F5Y16DRAFT_355970 [Xylariaceae sp. FL0255]